MNRRWLMMLGLCLAMMPGLLSAQMDEEEDPFMERPERTDEAKKWHEKNLKTYTNSLETLVLPGLVAKRKEQKVEVLVESTRIANNEAGEYFLIDQDSSHGYEALFWSFASPSDIHKALEFIGIRAGAPRDPRYHRYWSKGERVVVTVEGPEDSHRLESLIYDEDADKPLPEEGFIFTGSMTIKNPTGGTERVYVADKYDPRSIIPAYNEPASVLDIPWQATKGEFYESHVMNPEFTLKANAIYTLLFEPEEKGGKKRSRDLRMKITEGMDFILTDTEDGKKLGTNSTYQAALEACRDIIDGGQEPYVVLTFSDGMKLAHIKAVASALVMLDRPGGLYLEPPSETRLYYRAFLPNPAWRDPENRMSQPWELHITMGKKGKLACEMVIHDTDWKMGKSKPDLTKRAYKVTTAEGIRERLLKEDKEREENSRRLPPQVLLIFVSGDLKYGELLEFLGPALKVCNTVHLFLEEDVSEEEPGEGPADTPDED